MERVCNGVMHGNVCPVKRSGPGLVTEERREEEEKWHPVIRAPDVMTPARTLGAGIALTHNTPGRKHVMRVF